MTDGERLRDYIQGLRNVTVKSIYEGLKMSKTNLYQFFDTQSFTEETKKKFEDYFGEKIFSETATKNYRQELANKRINGGFKHSVQTFDGVPIYDVPIDASFLERYQDQAIFQPLYSLNIPKLRNCNFGAIISGSSMYPIMKSGSIAMCRIVEDLNYIDPGEMYLISTKNGFETVKYVQVGEKKDELILIPHNEKIKPTTIKKSMIVRMCIVEAWINFR